MFEYLIYVFIVIMILILIRAALGPSFADRAVALSALGNILVLIMVIYSITIQNPMYLDIAIVFAMLSFAGLLAIAKYAVWHHEIKQERGDKK